MIKLNPLITRTRFYGIDDNNDDDDDDDDDDGV